MGEINITVIERGTPVYIAGKSENNYNCIVDDVAVGVLSCNQNKNFLHRTVKDGGKLFYFVKIEDSTKEISDENYVEYEWYPSHLVSRLTERNLKRKKSIPIPATSFGIDLGLFKWRIGLDDRPDNSKLFPIVSLLLAIQYDKEGGYGSSWKGKGEYRGIMSNIDRKYDRLDKMTTDELIGSRDNLSNIEQRIECGRLSSDKVGESKIDAVADLANYSLLYMTYLKDTYPNLFKLWVKQNIPKYLLDKMDIQS